MKDIIFDDFQNSVNDSLLRHKSILDVLTKFSESNARVNRAIAKSVTNCGCIEVNAKKQKISEDNIINNLHDSLDDHLNGTLCESCREVIESEIGNNLYYHTALCNLLNLNLYDIVLKESDKVNTVGNFTFR